MKHQFGSDFSGPGPVSGQFEARNQKLIERARSRETSYHLIRATWQEIQPWIEQARETLALASNATIESVLAHNPEVIRLITNKKSGEKIGLFAYLPLNEEGAESITQGLFNGGAPNLDQIAKQGEEPVAIYVWLVHAPGKLGRSVAAFAECVDDLAPKGLPVFSRAVTEHSERLHATRNFMKAQDVYQGAPDWLWVCLPTALDPTAKAKKEGPQIEVRCVRTLEDLMQVFAVRSATYMAEQLCRYEEEFDGNDFCGTHLLGLVNGDAAGCARIRYFGDFAKLERVAVLPKYRNTRLAYRLARTALNHCQRKNFKRVYGHSRADLVRFWKVFGFRVLEDREPFAFANVEYREIVVDLEPDKDAIRWGVDPMKAIRQEGYWEETGPLELSNLNASDAVAAEIRQNSRMLRG